MEPVDGDVRKRIQKLRKERKLTLRELEKLSGVSRTTISLYERGRVKMNLETLERIARALEVPLGVLLSGSPEGHASVFDVAFFRKLSRLSPERQRSVLSYLEFLLAEERKKKRGEKGAS